MADDDYVKDRDDGALSIKETPPTPRSPGSGFRCWLFPALGGMSLLILITVLGTAYIKMSNHLWSVEQRLSNQNDIIQSLHTTMQQGEDTKMPSFTSVEQRVSNLSEVIKLLDTSLQHAQETAKEVQQLQFAVESNKDQLTSVSEALKQLSAIDSLSRSVASIKCSLNHILNNSSGAAGCCPPDWTAFESSCYYFSRLLLSWNDSRDWCETRQAHLAILHTDVEWDFVTHRSIPERFWIGLSDRRTGSWEWVDQTPYTVEPRRWGPDQPDSRAGSDLHPGSEDCAVLDSDGHLNDLYCSLKRRFICQKDEFKERLPLQDWRENVTDHF